MASKNNAWKRLGITEKYIDGCMAMANSAVSEKSVEYWNNCAEFLQRIKDFEYTQLSRKQRNWAFSIKEDLAVEGMI